ncbi:unnamed protein product [Brugia timori]|uniref:TPP_enzyme_N domain-containing protein n=1 Tax=Brugia timori TaxID=42155 RepID=A0A0R3R9H7_9BILA|nr:unnamed protein product [Brugia timori]
MIRAGGATPIIVLSQNTTRESGHQVQAGNIAAAKVLILIIIDPENYYLVLLSILSFHSQGRGTVVH